MLAHVDDLAHVHPHPSGLPLEVIALVAVGMVLLAMAFVAARHRGASDS